MLVVIATIVGMMVLLIKIIVLAWATGEIGLFNTLGCQGMRKAVPNSSGSKACVISREPPGLMTPFENAIVECICIPKVCVAIRSSVAVQSSNTKLSVGSMASQRSFLVWRHCLRTFTDTKTLCVKTCKS